MHCNNLIHHPNRPTTHGRDTTMVAKVLVRDVGAPAAMGLMGSATGLCVRKTLGPAGVGALVDQQGCIIGEST